MIGPTPEAVMDLIAHPCVLLPSLRGAMDNASAATTVAPPKIISNVPSTLTNEVHINPVLPAKTSATKVLIDCIRTHLSEADVASLPLPVEYKLANPQSDPAQSSDDELVTYSNDNGRSFKSPAMKIKSKQSNDELSRSNLSTPTSNSKNKVIMSSPRGKFPSVSLNSTPKSIKNVSNNKKKQIRSMSSHGN
jgi:hypothetical protein